MGARRLIYAGIAVALATAMLFALPGPVSDLWNWLEEGRLRALIERAGALGPVLIIVLMCGAVVFSPIPSAPIALAAGAAYGHTFGTLWVVLGAEAGALIAFAIARWLGRDAVRHWLAGSALGGRFTGSQALLMWLVFVSRLMPFVSFDMVSYAAGLSALSFWRFAVATFAGILPASFLLAHLGGEMVSGRPAGALWLVVGLGLITGLPLAIAALRARRRPGRG